jgi:N-acyl-phosphatidylethanolamine-hydrolysing phospholipase D
MLKGRTRKGRYMNVTFEYREQGVHEFLFHQLIWRPLSGQLFWNGGIADRAELDANLPIEPMNWPKLRKASRKGKERAVEEESRGHSVPQSGNTSEEEWEKLEHSRVSAPITRPDSEADANDKITVTWFGQSTCLVQMQGVTFLTDPVFGDKTIDSIFASPRLRDTPCSLSELLQQDIVDVVLLSHDHFDHLDENVVKSLGNKALWIIPLGLASWFKKRGVTSVQEMDWWGNTRLASLLSMGAANDLEIHCTPAQHWSGRTPWGANQSLWCGFVVKSRSSRKSFYHCGDTGYSPGGIRSLYSSNLTDEVPCRPLPSYRACARAHHARSASYRVL